MSKYIGETEKNLARVFDMAEHKRWILFLDEADALFGKRTRVEEPRDRFANQEISFLLQRIEDFDGVVILASNLKSNIDDAFLRRFQSIVHFPVPKQTERKRIWTEAFPRKARLEESVDLARIAEKYDVTGGMIMNVVQYASLMALSRGGSTVLGEELREAVRRQDAMEQFPPRQGSGRGHRRARASTHRRDSAQAGGDRQEARHQRPTRALATARSLAD